MEKETKHTPEVIPNYLSERIAFLADTTSARPWESGRMKIFATRVASEMILNKDNNLIAVINNQSDRIIEAEQSSKALLRMIERLEGELSEMKKEREELKDYLLEKVKQRMIDNVILEPRNNMSMVELAVREECRWIQSIIKYL